MGRNLVESQGSSLDDVRPITLIESRVLKNGPKRFYNGPIVSLRQPILLRRIRIRGSTANQVFPAEIVHRGVYEFSPSIGVKNGRVVTEPLGLIVNER